MILPFETLKAFNAKYLQEVIVKQYLNGYSKNGKDEINSNN